MFIVTVIIPTFNRPEQLSKCLDCLCHYFDQRVSLTTEMTIEVLVCDDSRNTATKQLLKDCYPWACYSEGPAKGPASNRNHGAQISSGEWLVFTDDDCLPQPGWLEAYARFADHSDVLEGKTSAKGARRRLDDECPVNESGGYLWACNFAIRKQLFFQLGGFNENFPAPAMEDVELHTRMKKRLISPLFVSEAVVLHPWRRRKGLEFIRIHAASYVYYRKLHPVAASHSRIPSLFISLLRSFKKNTMLAIAYKNCHGLTRQVILDFCSIFMTWKAMR